MYNTNATSKLDIQVIDRLDTARHPSTGEISWYDKLTEKWYDGQFNEVRTNLFSAHG